MLKIILTIYASLAHVDPVAVSPVASMTGPAATLPAAVCCVEVTAEEWYCYVTEKACDASFFALVCE